MCNSKHTGSAHYVPGSAHCACIISLNNIPSPQRGGSHCCSILQMNTGNPTERIIQQECARPGAKCFTCLTSFKLHRNPMRQVLRLGGPPPPPPLSPGRNLGLQTLLTTTHQELPFRQVQCEALFQLHLTQDSRTTQRCKSPPLK